MTVGRYAVVLNAPPTERGRTLNALAYAVDLHDHGHDVEVFFDGSATKWPGYLARNPDDPVMKRYREVRDRDLIGGVCGKCAVVHGTAEAAQAAGAELLGDGDSHGPSVGELAGDGYELLVI